MYGHSHWQKKTLLIPAVFLAASLLAGCRNLRAGQPTEVHVFDFLTKPSEPATVAEVFPTAPSEMKDRTAPQILGVRDLVVYEGDAISYLSGVTAEDDWDFAPAVTVDSSQVDLATPGTYEVVYSATDAAGNSNCTAATVTVLEKQSGFADMDTIYAAVDSILQTLTGEDASVEEQICAIYRWARTSLCYAGHSDRTDWRQTAYTMLTEGRGDCFGYYAVTKLLFERLGIPNIDVQKVRNSENDSDHFWSLVSVDDGETYYHFDATPRYGSGDDFCLVTDAFLDAYSEDHRNSHNRDKSLYPTTPEEAL